MKRRTTRKNVVTTALMDSQCESSEKSNLLPLSVFLGGFKQNWSLFFTHSVSFSESIFLMNIHLGLYISHPHWSAHCVDANYRRNELGSISAAEPLRQRTTSYGTWMFLNRVNTGACHSVCLATVLEWGTRCCQTWCSWNVTSMSESTVNFCSLLLFSHSVTVF